MVLDRWPCDGRAEASGADSRPPGIRDLDGWARESRGIDRPLITGSAERVNVRRVLVALFGSVLLAACASKGDAVNGEGTPTAPTAATAATAPTATTASTVVTARTAPTAAPSPTSGR